LVQAFKAVECNVDRRGWCDRGKLGQLPIASANIVRGLRELDGHFCPERVRTIDVENFEEYKREHQTEGGHIPQCPQG
jgi:hypothetical protein